MSEVLNPLKRLPTWYGMEAVIEIRSRVFHRAGFGKWLIPHPPVVNGLLRLGLPNKSYDQLSIIHEFGHFQTLPILMVYIALAIGWAFNTPELSWLKVVLVLLSVHSMAEILAELYVRMKTGREYALYYQHISRIPRIIFWLVFLLLSIPGWNIVFQSFF